MCNNMEICIQFTKEVSNLTILSLSIKYKVKVKVAQSRSTLCDPMNYTVHGILQARILEWVAFPFSRGSSQTQGSNRSPALQVDPLPAKPPREAPK